MITNPSNFSSHFPKSKKEEQEFGKSKGAILICKDCNAVYFYKSWHHKLEEYPGLEKAKNLNFTVCPACRMIKDNEYEGEIILENTPEAVKKEVKNLARNFGERAFNKDPMDRVISITDNSSGIRILTTENQLAQRLAKKIKETFDKRAKISISHSKEESVLRAKISF